MEDSKAAPRCIFCLKTHFCPSQVSMPINSAETVGFHGNVRVAVPIFKKRVSPVLDTCARLFLIESNEIKQDVHRTIPLKGSIYERANEIRKIGIGLIICGAVGEAFYNLLREAGIELLCGISGDIDEIIEAYRKGNLKQPKFRMPGFE